MSFIYISYDPADAILATNVRGRLEAEGYNTWMDDSRETTDENLAIIRNALTSAAALVAVSRGEAFSDLVQWEVAYAQQRVASIFAISKIEDFAWLAEQLEALDIRQPERIALPSPLRWDPPTPSYRSRLGRLGWVILAIALIGAGLWIMQLLTLSRFGPSEPATTTPTIAAIVLPETSPVATLTLVTTETPTPTSSATLTMTATATVTPTRTATLTPSATASVTSTATDTSTVTSSPTATATNTSTATPTVTASPTSTATATATPTATRTPTPSPTATATPTAILYRDCYPAPWSGYGAARTLVDEHA